MANQPELKLHQQAYKWFHNHYPDLRLNMWYIENEGTRDKRQQMIVKSLGLTSGVADLNFLYAGTFHAIELKNGKKGRQTKSQRKWQSAIERQGGQYHIVRSLEEFQHLIKSIL